METMNKLRITPKKSFEEHDEDICNFDSFASEKSDYITNSKTLKENLTKNKKSSSIKKKINGSRLSTKESINVSNQNIQTNNISNLHELIESLKDKITIYETDMRSLLDEKVEMQMQINNLQKTVARQAKKEMKTSKSNKSNIDLQQSNDSNTNNIPAININYEDLNKELNYLSNNIARQKQMINNMDLSILNTTISDNNLNTNKDANNKEREHMMEEIKALKSELYNLIDLQKQVADNSEINNEEKSIKEPEVVNNNSIVSNNLLINNNINNGILPNIENFFVLNGKVMLVDCDKSVYHLKKCNKYQEYSKANPNKYETKEEIFAGFLEYYQNLTKNNIKDQHNNNNRNNKAENTSEEEASVYTEKDNKAINNIEKNIQREIEVEKELDTEKEQDHSFEISDSDVNC